MSQNRSFDGTRRRVRRCSPAAGQWQLRPRLVEASGLSPVQPLPGSNSIARFLRERENESQTDAAVPGGRRAAVPKCRPAHSRGLSPAPAAKHAVRTRLRTDRIVRRRSVVVVVSVPIRTPFPYIAVHVVHSPSVRVCPGLRRFVPPNEFSLNHPCSESIGLTVAEVKC